MLDQAPCKLVLSGSQKSVHGHDDAILVRIVGLEFLAQGRVGALRMMGSKAQPKIPLHFASSAAPLVSQIQCQVA